MSERLIARVKLGGYSKRIEIARLPPEEIGNDISAFYDERFGEYYSIYDPLKRALANAPDHARGLIWRATLRLYKDVHENKISSAKADYTMYRNVLRRIGADAYLDDALKAVGIYDMVVGAGGGGGGGGGSVL
ncbi:MAG: hypothetical protein JZD41_07670 [Thermoproteus sp.]|nr:hypothetical protein [Thermoproteus sp.]